MNKGWPKKPLGDLCEVFADGDWVESKDQSPEGVRLIQTGNVGEGYFKDRAEKARYISEATFKRLRCTEIFEGDCLVSRLPDPVGRTCILPQTEERMITAVDCTIVRFKPDQVLPAFFNLYSQSADYLRTVAEECTGTTRNRISRSKLALTPIPVPPLAEQQRIVGLLDEAFEDLATAKANAEKNLQNARALFESHLQSVFAQRGTGWVVRSVTEIARHSLGKMLDKAKNKGEPQPYLRNINVRWFAFDLSDLLQMPFLPTETDKYTAIKGDVLICEGGYPGRSGTWQIRYYQEIAVERVLEKVADGTDRILLTLATGTGKTSIAFQIAWKRFQTRWNLSREPSRRPRILFLADRNTLANQAFNDFNSFAAFEDKALVRIDPAMIRQAGRVPKNASVFFTIF